MAIRKIRGSWWIDVRIGKRRYRKKSPDNSRTGALAFEHRFRSTSRRFSALPPEARAVLEADGSFRAFAGIWCAVYVQPRMALSTREGYVAVLKRSVVPHFGDLELADIDEAAVDLFIQQEKERGASAKTINNALGILRRALTVARRWRLVEDVPDIEFLKAPPSAFDYFTAAESRLLLQAAVGTRWWLFILCALRTGMRCSELIALRWEDIDLETGSVHVRRGRFHGVEKAPKNNRFRTLPLTPDLWRSLRDARQPLGYVFTGTTGDPLSWDAAYRGVRATCRLAGLREVGVHTLRHSFASQLYAGGIDLLPIQMLMGHSSIEVTTRYAHLPHPMLRMSVHTLSDPALSDGHHLGTEQHCATLPSAEEQRLESANVGTEKPPRKEEASLVPRRGFEGSGNRGTMANLSGLPASHSSQR